MSYATDAAIGMMDGAYFTSRKEILDFLNNLLDLNLTKIEQTASGAVACQLTEYLFPNSIPMSRVNWAAKASHEYVANYKLLQSAFDKNNIQKHVDVDKLIRGKYQDNLEFCQWLKAFFDQTCPMMAGRDGYDPVAVRAKGKGGKAVERRKGKAVLLGGGASSSSRGGAGGSSSVKRSASKPSGAISSARPASSSSSTTSSRMSSSSSRIQKENMNNSMPPTSVSEFTPSSRKLNASMASSSSSSVNTSLYEEQLRKLKTENKQLQTKYSELEQSSAELEITLQNVESERDFYFDKLRGIETMLQVFQETKDENGVAEGAEKVIQKIFKVMYATMEDNVVVDDEGNLIGDNISVEPVNEESIYLEANTQDPGHESEEEEEEELLTSDLNDPVINDSQNSRNNNDIIISNNNMSMDKATANNAYDNHHDYFHDRNNGEDNEERIVTSGINDIALSPIADSSMRKETFQRVALLHHDDDDFGDDDDLLAD